MPAKPSVQTIVGSQQMYFFRIGSNITALREFTALCKVDSIPLKKYLLGNHLESLQEPHWSAATKRQRSGQNDLVEVMGGVSGLGKVSVPMIVHFVKASVLGK